MGPLVVVIFIGIFVIILVTAQARASKRAEAYEALARRYNGRFESGGWF